MGVNKTYMKHSRLLLTVTFLTLVLVQLTGQGQSYSIMDDIAYLASDELEGRETGTEGNEMARQYLMQRFESLDLEPFWESYLQPFTFQTEDGAQLEGKNIVGTITGKTDKYIVITAHYDHIGRHDGQIFNGADDNASGSAGLLALVDYFKKHPPKNHLIFVAFDAEEKGLQGAKHFVNSLSVPKSSVLLNVNMDMISRSDKNEIYACGTNYYPQFKKLLKKADKRSPAQLKYGHDRPELGHDDWTFSSDHGPFHRAEIPFVYFGVEDHPDYHKESDEVDKISPEFVQSTVKLITRFVQLIDKKGVR